MSQRATLSGSSDTIPKEESEQYVSSDFPDPIGFPAPVKRAHVGEQTPPAEQQEPSTPVVPSHWRREGDAPVGSQQVPQANAPQQYQHPQPPIQEVPRIHQPPQMPAPQPQAFLPHFEPARPVRPAPQGQTQPSYPTRTSAQPQSQHPPREQAPTPRTRRERAPDYGNEAEREYINAETFLERVQHGVPGKPHSDVGLRRLVWEWTGGRVNLGLTKNEKYMADLIAGVQTPLHGNVRHVAVLSQKGGIGKTTTSAGLGIALASNRTDRILALDVNPDGGSLATRVPSTSPNNILDLRDVLRRGYVTPADFENYVNMAAHRLESIVMPPGRKPEEPLSGEDYEMIADAIQDRYQYRIILTDCGTNLTDSVMSGVLARADQLVVVTSTKQDEAAVVAGGLEGLSRQGYAHLVREAVVVIVEKAPEDSKSTAVDRRERAEDGQAIRNYFSKVAGSLFTIPYDPHISRGTILDLSKISEEARTAYLEVAREVVLNLAAQ